MATSSSPTKARNTRSDAKAGAGRVFRGSLTFILLDVTSCRLRWTAAAPYPGLEKTSKQVTEKKRLESLFFCPMRTGLPFF